MSLAATASEGSSRRVVEKDGNRATRDGQRVLQPLVLTRAERQRRGAPRSMGIAAGRGGEKGSTRRLPRE